MAIFFTANGTTHIISNTMSVFNAGFREARSYYNKRGDRLTYYIREDGTVLERFTAHRKQPFMNVYATKDEANAHFSYMNKGLTFETGKWVTEKKG